MKEKLAYSTYAISAVVACFLAWQGLLFESIGTRIYGLLAIAFVYYLYKGFSGWLFYASLLVVSFGEAFVVLGFENYKFLTSFTFIIYYWLNFFLVKNNVRETVISIRFSRFIPAIISFVAIVLVVIITFNMIAEGLGNSSPVVFTAVASFLFLITYLWLVYNNKRSVRNFWLIAFLISVCLAQAFIPMESIYYNSHYLKTIGYLAEIASHFFMLQFLIIPESSVVNDDKSSYL